MTEQELMRELNIHRTLAKVSAFIGDQEGEENHELLMRQLIKEHQKDWPKPKPTLTV